jgi:hypothetical protein
MKEELTWVSDEIVSNIENRYPIATMYALGYIIGMIATFPAHSVIFDASAATKHTSGIFFIPFVIAFS